MRKRMNHDAIGVFDSGMGGLTTVKELNRLLPHENIIYFGDTARVPYGSRSPETIMRYAREDAAFLRQYQVKMIIAACGTVSSVVGDQPLVTDMPFTGVIYPAVEAACAATRTKRIGVIGTPATIKSASYRNAILKQHPDYFVAMQACPLFVHLVENGYTDFHNPVTRLVAEEYLTPIKAQKVDTLILGCTHYPVIADLIGDIMGDDVTLISSGAEAANYAKRCLQAQNLLSDRTEKGKNTYYVSDSVELFTENAAHFLQEEVSGAVYRSNRQKGADC
jgi:glutamate racemase